MLFKVLGGVCVTGGIVGLFTAGSALSPLLVIVTGAAMITKSPEPA